MGRRGGALIGLATLAWIAATAGTVFAQSPPPLSPPFADAPCHATKGDLPRPALTGQFADPFVYCAGGRFLVVASNWAGVHIPAAASADLSSWAVLRDADGAPVDAMPALPPWAVGGDGVRPDVWAPEVARLGDRWALFFSARAAAARTPGGQPRQCIGRAVSDRPDGGFVSDPRPLICDFAPEGVIDPSLLRVGGASYLYFKSDGNCCGRSTTLYVVALADDLASLAGTPTPVGVTNDRDWEGEVVEAPTMVLHAGRFILFYSGGLYFTPAYGVAYAACAGPVGPCRKPDNNRLLQSYGRLDGPGHQSVFTADGRSFMAFHALSPEGSDGPDRKRELHIEALTWDGERPSLGALCAFYGGTDASGVQAACPWAPLPAK